MQRARPLRRPQPIWPILLWALLIHRGAATAGGAILAVALFWLDRRLEAVFFGYVVFDAILSIAALPATFALGWRYVVTYSLVSATWLIGAWSLAPSLTRAAGL